MPWFRRELTSGRSPPKSTDGQLTVDWHTYPTLLSSVLVHVMTLLSVLYHRNTRIIDSDIVSVLLTTGLAVMLAQSKYNSIYVGYTYVYGGINEALEFVSGIFIIEVFIPEVHLMCLIMHYHYQFPMFIALDDIGVGVFQYAL